MRVQVNAVFAGFLDSPQLACRGEGCLWGVCGRPVGFGGTFVYTLSSQCQGGRPDC